MGTAVIILGSVLFSEWTGRDQEENYACVVAKLASYNESTLFPSKRWDVGHWQTKQWHALLEFHI